MRSSTVQFPYPFLAIGRRDYTDSEFRLIEKEYDDTSGAFNFRFSCVLNCAGIETMINDGSAEAALLVSSPATKYRDRICFSPGKDITISISKDSLAKDVTFKAQIAAKSKCIFSLPEHNSEFYGTNQSFNLRKGDVLAESQTIVFTLDDSELQRPLSSIFNIDGTRDELTEGIRTILDEEKIKVVLPQKTYERYDLIKKGYPVLRRTINALVTLPILVDAVAEISDTDDSEYSDKRWYTTVKQKLKETGLDDFEGILPCQAANRIYGLILNDALDRLYEVIEEFTRGEEEDFRSID